jgi:hypothetical protein
MEPRSRFRHEPQKSRPSLMIVDTNSGVHSISNHSGNVNKWVIYHAYRIVLVVAVCADGMGCCCSCRRIVRNISSLFAGSTRPPRVNCNGDIVQHIFRVESLIGSPSLLFVADGRTCTGKYSLRNTPSPCIHTQVCALLHLRAHR